MTSASPKLPAEINSGTRSLHTHLNALITSRLPLALPPHAESPLTYATGLIPFARVYIAFEKAWEEVCARPISPRQSVYEDDLWVDVPLDMRQSRITEQGDEKTAPSESAQSSPPMQALVLALLRSLRPHGLARTARLKRDLATLLGIDATEVETVLSSQDSDATQAFIDHIDAVVADKPYLLIAYAFTLYLAIFSGGRWIRSILAAPGQPFWAQCGSDSASSDAGYVESSVHEKLRSFTAEQQDLFEEAGLSMWFFPSRSDGADIKAEFKKRLEGAEALLSPDMKAGIVDEAREIFVRCESLVHELDEYVGRQGKIINGGERYGSADSDKSPAMSVPPAKGWAGRTWHAAVELGTKYDVPGYAAWALVLSSVSWYAMYHAGSWYM